MIKVGGIGRWAGVNMSKDWTLGQRINRRVGKRLYAMNSGIGRKDWTLHQGDQTLRESTCRLDNKPKERTMRRRIEQSARRTDNMADNI